MFCPEETLLKCPLVMNLSHFPPQDPKMELWNKYFRVTSGSCCLVLAAGFTDISQKAGDTFKGFKGFYNVNLSSL